MGHVTSHDLKSLQSLENYLLLTTKKKREENRFLLVLNLLLHYLENLALRIN